MYTLCIHTHKASNLYADLLFVSFNQSVHYISLTHTHTHTHTLYYTEPRVHFALSLGCASSPRIRIYQARVFKSQYTVA
jgi:hypothetical protein